MFVQILEFVGNHLFLSGIFHYDEKALLNKAKKDDVHWHWEDEDGNAIRKLTQEEIDKHI